MIIYSRRMLRADGSVVGIDREFVVMFTVDNENLSWLFFDYLQTYAKLTLAQIQAAILTTARINRSADMVPDNIGIWLFHCHVNDHIIAGMINRYQVLP